jgi:hypothetical protein
VLLLDDCGCRTGTERVACGLSLSSTAGACTGTCCATATTGALAKAAQTRGFCCCGVRASCWPDSRQPYDNVRGRVPSLIPSRQSRRQGQYFHHGMCPTTPPCATSM